MNDAICPECGNDNLTDYPVCPRCAKTCHFTHRSVCLHCKEETDETRRDYDIERMAERSDIVRLLATPDARHSDSLGRALEVA